ncbi:30S ribosomal protein S9 [Patescibacteria group bacterium]
MRYFEAVGRRKTAVARVRIQAKGEGFLINDKPYQKYFPSIDLQKIVEASLEKMKCLERFKVSVKVKGGGFHAQAEAVRQGIARALVLFNPEFKKNLRKLGFLTRDARKRERKKFGLKRARRAPQWSKR